ncbi:hypothetical protein F2Q70_00007891 [Brassica cretica]|uniref:Uncharacterized protein n=1 Tax=Brassica cretica TaxID=69181 RepID=A0A8S9M6P0_BRACR|nr:hypothetical protein F2Q70_00007891 [Brassica cretica]
MSFTIPMTSFDWKLPEIALMSVKLSKKTLSVKNSKVSSMLSGDRIAMASAIWGELMKISTVSPWNGVSRPGPKKTHPKPGVNLSLFQAVSGWLLGACLTRS